MGTITPAPMATFAPRLAQPARKNPTRVPTNAPYPVTDKIRILLISEPVVMSISDVDSERKLMTIFL